MKSLILVLFMSHQALAHSVPCEKQIDQLVYDQGKLRVTAQPLPFSTMKNRSDNLTDLGNLSDGTSVLANVRELQKLHWTNRGEKNTVLVSHLNLTYLDVDFFIGGSQFLGGRSLGTFATVDLRFKTQKDFDQNLLELKTSLKARKLSASLLIDQAARTLTLESLDLSKLEQQRFLDYVVGKYVDKQKLDAWE